MRVEQDCMTGCKVCLLVSCIAGLIKVLQKNKDSEKRMVATPHEIIASDSDSLAYEKGHFIHYMANGGICNAGV